MLEYHLLQKFLQKNGKNSYKLIFINHKTTSNFKYASLRTKLQINYDEIKLLTVVTVDKKHAKKNKRKIIYFKFIECVFWGGGGLNVTIETGIL